MESSLREQSDFDQVLAFQQDLITQHEWNTLADIMSYQRYMELEEVLQVQYKPSKIKRDGEENMLQIYLQKSNVQPIFEMTRNRSNEEIAKRIRNKLKISTTESAQFIERLLCQHGIVRIRLFNQSILDEEANPRQKKFTELRNKAGIQIKIFQQIQKFYNKAKTQFQETDQNQKNKKNIAKILRKQADTLICGQCRKLVNLVKMKNENFYMQLTDTEIPRTAQFYPEFTQDINWTDERVQICYNCSKINLDEAYNERCEAQEPILTKLKNRNQIYNLMLGNIHSYIDNKKGGIYFHLHGNQDFKTYDTSISAYFQELSRKDCWWHHMTKPERMQLVTAVDYLKKRNHLFQSYYCNFEIYETIKGNNELIDLLNDKMNGKILPSNENFQKGILVASENEEYFLLPKDLIFSDTILGRKMNIGDIQSMDNFSISDISLTEQIKDRIEKLTEKRELQNEGQSGYKNRIYYSNRFVEEMLFPILFQNGYGGYNSNYMITGMTPKQYIRMRLLSCRPEYRLNTDYIFWWYDRIKKEEILCYNRGVKYVNRREYDFTLTQKDIMTQVQGQERTEYFRKKLSYKHMDTPKYWQAKWYELQTLISYFAKQHYKPTPDLFITLTLNEKDPYLIELKKHKTSLLDPVASVCHFYAKARETLKRIYGSEKKRGLFGRCIGYFEKVEFQNRGAPHLHILVWLDQEGTRLLEEGNIIQGTLPENEHDRQMVQKFQIHNCIPERCYKDPRYKFCRYGYPQPLIAEDEIQMNRWLYRRTCEEERRIAPYNLELLRLFNGNICVLRMTSQDITQYMVKYIAKTSPEIDLTLKYPSLDKDKNSVISYIRNRKVSSCNAVWNLLGLQMVNAKPHVQFVDINLPRNKGKILRPVEEIKQLNEDDANIFLQNSLDRYYQRPPAYENITFHQFLTDYTYTLTKKNIPKGIKEREEFYINNTTGVYYWKRGTNILIQPRKWYPQNGEVYYYSIFFERVPHRRHNQLSQINKSQTWMEECFIRDIMIDVSSEEEAKQFWRHSSLNKKHMHQILIKLLAVPQIVGTVQSQIQKHANILCEIIEEDLENEQMEKKIDRLSQDQRIYTQEVQTELKNLQIFEGELGGNPLSSHLS